MFTVTTTRPRSTSRDAFSVMDALFSGLASTADATAPQVRTARPRIDVLERDNAYEVRAELPGVAREDVTVDIDETRVSITANVKQADAQDGVKLVYSERGEQSFARSFELAKAVDSVGSTARLENGVLLLTLPKREQPKPTRVAIS